MRAKRELRVLDWNIKVGNSPARVCRVVKRLAKKRHIDVVVLHECRYAWAKIADRMTKAGWRVVVSLDGPEAGSTMILVAPGRKAVRHGFLTMSRGWVGPKHGLRHVGRVHPWVDVDGGWRVLGVHRVTEGARRNADAWEEEHRRISRFLTNTRSERRKTFHVGDQNMLAYENRSTGSLKGMCDDIDHFLVTSGGGVDFGTANDATIAKARGTALKRWGSDHRARFYVLEAA